MTYSGTGSIMYPASPTSTPQQGSLPTAVPPCHTHYRISPLSSRRCYGTSEALSGESTEATLYVRGTGGALAPRDVDGHLMGLIITLAALDTTAPLPPTSLPNLGSSDLLKGWQAEQGQREEAAALQRETTIGKRVRWITCHGWRCRAILASFSPPTTMPAYLTPPTALNPLTQVWLCIILCKDDLSLLSSPLNEPPICTLATRSPNLAGAHLFSLEGLRRVRNCGKTKDSLEAWSRQLASPPPSLAALHRPYFDKNGVPLFFYLEDQPLRKERAWDNFNHQLENREQRH
ncbi:hypothetical protein F5887DRAFT_922168 [Amanita rubescens]|nr:hypothetical protein F5887DRAFT_922168 [Amanita rubescens]